MGGSSKQTTGYKYFSNFLLFIGNPIEKLLGINFDNRGWQTGKRVPMGSNGEMCYLHLPNLYGENEGGVSGTLNIKYGSDNQTVDPVYKNYMQSISLNASAYPYQSYISFSGGELLSNLADLSEEELQNLADEYADGIIPGKGFYLGNSGYMKEMLLWPKRIHVKNDGGAQWYDEKAEIPDFSSSDSGCSFITGTSEPTSCYWSDIGNISERKLLTTSASFRYSGSDKKGETYIEFVFEHGSSTDEIIEIQDFLASSCSSVDITCSKRLEVVSFNVQDFNKNDIFWDKQTSAVIRIKKGIKSEHRIKITFNFIGFVGSNYPEGKNSDFYFSRWLGIKYTSGWACYGSDLSPDINPIHKIREILTDDTAMNKPESDVNDINFMKAADRIFDEGLGVSWAITEKSCLDAINELCGHIEAGVRVNRQTGLYEMVLFRDDWFTDDEIHSLAVSKIKSMSLEVANADEAINQLNVSYYNRNAIKDSSFSVAENASIRNLNGRVNAEDADFPYFMNQRNAAVVSQWKLKQMSSPVWSGSFTTAAYEARKWNRYDLLKLAWPRKWQGTITVRIMKINLGTGTDVSIDFVEVVPYSSNLSSNIVIDTPIDVAPLPPQACQYEPFEMPYYLAVMALGQRQVDDELAYENNYGLVGVVAEKPQNNSLYAVMMTHDGTEGNEWLRAATIDYEAAADLDQTISKTSTSFTVKNSSALANIAAGTLVKCGSEWIVFHGVDLETGVVNVKRGALDFGPQSWQSGTKLYFCGNDVAYDQTEYIAGEEVLVAALTATPSSLQELDGSIVIEMNARAFRPYPPANVKINDEYWPVEIETDLVLTWVDRNRTQQTGGEILGWFDGGVTLESGVTYQLILTELDENQIELRTQNLSLGTLNTYTFQTSAMNANTRTIEITLKTLRDGFECLNPFFHTVELSQFFSAPYDLTVEFKND